MSQIRRANAPDLLAFDGDDGTEAPPDVNGYVTMGVDTYYIPLNTVEASLESIQIITDALIAGVFTLETSNVPRTDAEGRGAITDWTETAANAGKWVQENPPTAYIGTSGTGWSVSAVTLTKTAGLGGAMLHIGNLGSKRARIKATITTGGTARFIPHGKSS